MKKIISIILSAVIAFSLTACGSTSNSNSDYEANYKNKLKNTELNVFNWGEYIAEGEDGGMNVIKEFEKVTGIKVNYNTFDSNESMYAKLNSGTAYDILIPSDYMIERLINEKKLQKLDFSKLTNYKYISDDYKNLYFDKKNEYSVPYNVGMVGLIYDKTKVNPAPDSWSVMWDKKYKGQILTFNNSRDAFAIAQFLLGIDINSTNKKDWDKAAKKLKEQNPLLQARVMDEVFGKMESGEATIAPYYAGDYYTMLDTNENLGFVYPKEGTNIFVDSICIPKNAQNVDAAHLFINFLLEPKVALENAEYLCYASPNTAVVSNDEYSFKDDEILYPSKDKKPKTEYYHDIDSKTRDYFEKLWEEVILN